MSRIEARAREGNGTAAFGHRPSGPGGSSWALQVIEISGDRVVAINSFLDTARMFALFGLPATPAGAAA